MKLALIVKESWKDLPSRVVSLGKSISSKLPVKVEIDLILKDYGAIPADKNGRILPSWFKKVAKLDGYDGACILVSLSDRRKYGLKPTLRGHYIRDEDGFLDFWVASDRLTKRKGKPQFEETFSHELCHGLYHWLGIPKTPDETRHVPGHDNTHYFHDVKGSLDGAFKEISAAWPKPKVAQKEAANPNGLSPLMALIVRRTLSAMAELGKPMRLVEGFRSMERQAELYAQGRTKPGKIVTNAKPGQSQHNLGRAADLCFQKTGYSAPEADWQLYGMMAKSFGAEWGGDWKGFVDRPHIEV